jgi:TRAP-type C4-dicarboxylate transport system permease small subunit
MKKLETILRVTEIVVKILYIAGAISLCTLFVLTFGDLAGRYLFDRPIIGTLEYSEYLLVAIAFFPLGFAQLTGVHIRVEFLINRFPVRMQTVMNIFVLVLLIGFFVIMTVQIGERAYISWSDRVLLSGTTVKLPIWWPSFVGSFGCAMLAFALLTQLIRNIIGLIQGRMVGFVTWTQ